VSFLSLVGVEFKKLRRSKISLIFIIPVFLIWGMAVTNADVNFNASPMGISPENNFFIQSFLGFAWFMLPASLVVITVLLTQTERANHGLIKMLSLPISGVKLCMAKYCVCVIIMTAEVLLMFAAYFPSAMIASARFNYEFMLDFKYVLEVCGAMVLVSLPMSAVYWMISVLLKNPVTSVGFGLATVVPVVLAINTKVWYAYPMCYPMMLIASEMNKFAADPEASAMGLVPWIPVAVILTVVSLVIACLQFGKSERK